MEYKDMSNAELKLAMDKLTNNFEHKKNELVELCKEMENLEREFLTAKKELELRKNIFN